MQINLKGIQLEITPSLQLYIEQKFGPLVRFVKKFDDAGSIELDLQLARTTKHHHKGPIYRAEAHLRLPKKVVRIAEENYDIRAAVDILKDKLRIALEKYKEIETMPERELRGGRKK